MGLLEYRSFLFDFLWLWRKVVARISYLTIGNSQVSLKRRFWVEERRKFQLQYWRWKFFRTSITSDVNRLAESSNSNAYWYQWRNVKSRFSLEFLIGCVIKILIQAILTEFEADNVQVYLSNTLYSFCIVEVPVRYWRNRMHFKCVVTFTPITNWSSYNIGACLVSCIPHSRRRYQFFAEVPTQLLSNPVTQGSWLLLSLMEIWGRDKQHETTTLLTRQVYPNTRILNTRQSSIKQPFRYTNSRFKYLEFYHRQKI